MKPFNINCILQKIQSNELSGVHKNYTYLVLGIRIRSFEKCNKQEYNLIPFLFSR